MLQDMDFIEPSCVDSVEVGMINRHEHGKFCDLTDITFGIALLTYIIT